MTKLDVKSSFLSALICLVFLTGCVSLKQSNQLGIKKTNKLDAFNGIYQNTQKTTDSLIYSSLWSQLSLTNNWNAAEFKNAKIELIAFDKYKLKAIWWQDNTQKATLILNGKLKDNYFVSKHKRKVIPIPLIYGEFKNNQFQLSINEHNELIVDRLENQWGWVFLFMANNNSTRKYEYKRLN